MLFFKGLTITICIFGLVSFLSACRFVPPQPLPTWPYRDPIANLNQVETVLVGTEAVVSTLVGQM